MHHLKVISPNYNLHIGKKIIQTDKLVPSCSHSTCNVMMEVKLFIMVFVVFGAAAALHGSHQEQKNLIKKKF